MFCAQQNEKKSRPLKCNLIKWMNEDLIQFRHEDIALFCIIYDGEEETMVMMQCTRENPCREFLLHYFYRPS